MATVVTVVVATIVATVVGIVVVMTMGIVDLPGAHHIEEAVIILQGTRPMVEDQGGTDPGPFLFLLAQKGSMLVVVGEPVTFWHPL